MVGPTPALDADRLVHGKLMKYIRLSFEGCAPRNPVTKPVSNEQRRQPTGGCAFRNDQTSNTTMKVSWTLAIATAALCTGAGRASAQEFALYTGPLTGEHSHSYAWSVDYTEGEGFGQYLAGSIDWLNEGHIPDHHRDGPLVQVWGRLPLAQRRFVVALGVSPIVTLTPKQPSRASAIRIRMAGASSTVRVPHGMHRSAGRRTYNSTTCR